MSTKKMTHAQRVAAKVAEGMNHVEAEIAVANEQHAEKIAKLKAKAASEQKAVEAMIGEIVKEMWPEVYAEAQTEARARREKTRADRAAKAKAARAAEPVVTDGSQERSVTSVYDDEIDG